MGGSNGSMGLVYLPHMNGWFLWFSSRKYTNIRYMDPSWVALLGAPPNESSVWFGVWMSCRV